MRLIVNDTQLDVKQKRIRLKKKNHILDDYNSHSMPFTVSNNVNNRAALQIGSVPETYTFKKDHPARLETELGIFEGTLKIKNIKANDIRCYFSGDGDLVYYLKNTKLNNIRFCNDIQTMWNGYEKRIGDGYAYAPIRNSKTTENDEFDNFNEQINIHNTQYIEDPGLLVYTWGNEHTTNVQTAQVPYLNLNHAIKKIFENTSYKLYNYYNNNNNFNDIYIYNNNSIIYREITGESQAYNINDIVKYQIEGSEHEELFLYIESDVYSESLFGNYGFCKIEIDDFEKLNEKKMFYTRDTRDDIGSDIRLHNVNPEIPDDYSNAKIKFLKVNTVRDTSRAQFFEKDTTAWDLIKGLQGYGFFLSINEVGKYVVFNHISNILEDYFRQELPDAQVDISNLENYDAININCIDQANNLTEKEIKTITPSDLNDPVQDKLSLPMTDKPGSIRLVQNEDQYYLLQNSYEEGKRWMFHSYGTAQYIETADNIKEKQLDIAMIPTMSFNNIQIAHPVNYYNSDRDTTTPIALFFLRRDPNFSEGHPEGYYTSNDVYDPRGEKIEYADFSLKFSGLYALQNTLLKKYIEILKDVIEGEANIPFTHESYSRLDFHKKQKIINTLFLVKEVDIEFNENGIKFGKTKLRRV